MILLMVFLSIALNHGDRATFSIAGPDMVKAAGLDIVALGYLISTFTWAYVLGQYPGGWLLDRFGSKRVLVSGVFTWSLFVFLVGFSTSFENVWVTRIMIFGFIFMMGLIEAPTLPANSRFLAAWFPARERVKHPVLPRPRSTSRWWSFTPDGLVLLSLRLGVGVLVYGRAGDHDCSGYAPSPCRYPEGSSAG